MLTDLEKESWKEDGCTQNWEQTLTGVLVSHLWSQPGKVSDRLSGLCLSQLVWSCLHVFENIGFFPKQGLCSWNEFRDLLHIAGEMAAPVVTLILPLQAAL